MREPTTLGELDFEYGACGEIENLGDILYPLCGSSSLKNNFIRMDSFSKGLTWTIWSYCLLWLVFCITVKVSKVPTVRHGRTFIAIPGQLKLWHDRRAVQLWPVVSTPLWSLCFCYQFWVISVYLQHSLIPYTWSFGQIIAVTVWVPSIVELFYILYSMYRYLKLIVVLADS